MGYLYALTAVFFWSFNIIIASYFATSLAPLEIAFGRWLVAAFILLPLAWKNMYENRKWLIKHRFYVLWLAITGIVLENTLIYYAGRTAQAVDMGLLDVTGPIFLVVLSRIFLKTPMAIKQVLGMGIAIIGVLIIIVQGNLAYLINFKFVTGDFIMLINAFIFAIYSLLQARRPAFITQSGLLAPTVFLGVIMLGVLMLTDVSTTELSDFNREDFLVIVYLGICNSVISYLAWNTALAKIGNIKTSIIYYILPLFSGIEAYFILGEKIYISELVGGALVIGGIALVSLHKKLAKKT